jgi:hypothetical protein
MLSIIEQFYSLLITYIVLNHKVVGQIDPIVTLTYELHFAYEEGRRKMQMLKILVLWQFVSYLHHRLQKIPC